MENKKLGDIVGDFFEAVDLFWLGCLYWVCLMLFCGFCL
jgi:hypothetical protein